MKKPTSALAPDASWAVEPEHGPSLAIRFMAWLSLLLGRRASRLVLAPIAVYFVLFARTASRASRDYLRAVAGRAPSLALRYRHIFDFAATIHDRIFLLAGRFADFELEVVGTPELFAASAARRGVILLGAHLGSFEILRALAHEHPDARVSMLMYEDNARKLNAVLAAVNPGVASEIIALGRPDSMLRVSETLDAGHYVGILADRSLSSGGSYTRSFLGRGAAFPLGPLRIAALLRRPVFFMVGLYLGGKRYRIVFEPLVDFAHAEAGTRDALIRSARERYVELLEQHCRQNPTNWFNFYDFWSSGADRPPA
jgi:predicted LPLAT superfamily acyltransferase